MDHVVPKSLFPKPRPDLITVPACGNGNAEKQRLDEYARDFLVMDFQGSQHPVAQRLFAEKVTTSIVTNRSVLGRTSLPLAHIRPFYTPSGLYLGDMPMMPMDDGLVSKWISFIVRGLAKSKLEILIPPEYLIRSRRVAPWNMRRIRGVFEGKPGGSLMLGNEIFEASERMRQKTSR